MLQFIIRRCLQALPILFAVSLVTFLMVHIMPGSVADNLVPPGAPPELVREIEAVYGFDRPLWVQYGLWVEQLLHGNLGSSLVTGRPIGTELLQAIGNSLKITVAAAIAGFAAGIAFGAIAAINKGRWPDRLFSFIAIAGVSVPHFWVAIMLVTVFAFQLNWLPAQGMGPSGFPTSWAHWRHMILPVFTLSLIPMGMVGRLVRASVIDMLSQDFVIALRGKGMAEDMVRAHIARNVAPTVLALMGLQFGYLIGGSIIVETVYNWPGTGKLLSLAIFSNDIPVIQATVLMLSFLFVFLNLAVDVAQAVIDPRMRR